MKLDVLVSFEGATVVVDRVGYRSILATIHELWPKHPTLADTSANCVSMQRVYGALAR